MRSVTNGRTDRQTYEKPKSSRSACVSGSPTFMSLLLLMYRRDSTLFCAAHCLVPPTIVEIPRDHQVTVNERIVLECRAEGVPTPIISWRINNTRHQSRIFSTSVSLWEGAVPVSVTVTVTRRTLVHSDITSGYRAKLSNVKPNMGAGPMPRCDLKMLTV